MPGKSHGRRSLVGYSPWGHKETDTTERLSHFHFSLSCIGEGNGNPFQCSCLENPRDGGAWWAAIYGVAQSQTRLKRLSSSSKSSLCILDTSPFFLCKSFLVFFDTSPLSEICFANTFSQSGACLFILLMVSSEKIFILMKFSLLTYSFMYPSFDVIYKKSLPNPRL